MTFDLAVTEKTGRKRAVNVSVKREVMKGVVDNLKEQVRLDSKLIFILM